MKNNVSISISTQDQADITAAISTLQAKLVPFLKALTDDERRMVLKMGDKSIAFVQKASAYADQYTDQLPGFLQLPELKKDVETVTVLNEYCQELSLINRMMEDTIMLAGSEALEASLVVYTSIKIAAKNNVGGAQEAFNDMKVRYSAQGRRKSQKAA